MQFPDSLQPFLSSEFIRTQIYKTQKLQSPSQRHPNKLFGPPVGVCSATFRGYFRAGSRRQLSTSQNLAKGTRNDFGATLGPLGAPHWARGMFQDPPRTHFSQLWNYFEHAGKSMWQEGAHLDSLWMPLGTKRDTKSAKKAPKVVPGGALGLSLAIVGPLASKYIEFA